MGELYRSGMANADLDKPLHRNVAGCLLATGDENGNRFSAFVNRGGQPVDLTGCTVTGYFIRPNMDTVVIEGGADVENSVAFVELPASCYAAAGVYSLAIKISLGGDTLTLCIFDGYIKQTQTGAVADPDEVIISVEQVLEKIAEMEAIAKDAKAAVASVAPAIEKTASGAVVTIADAAARLALSVVSEIRCLQLGGTEATPDNVKPIYHPLVQLYHGAAHNTAAEPVATASLPDAAFGGSYDWATGAVTVAQYQYVPKGADITSYGTASTGVPYVQLTLPEAWAGSGALCSHYRIVSGAPSSAAIRLVAPVGCYIYDPRFTDRATAAALLDAEKVQIVYALQEAKAVQVKPVGLMLLKGGNAVWSGVGDTSVRYVVDTKTYVDTHAGGGAGVDEVARAGVAKNAKGIAALSEENAKIIGAFPSGSTTVESEYPIEWVAGTLDEGKETEANPTLRKRSSRIEVGKGVFIEITNPDVYLMAKNVYAADGTWLGQVYTDETGNVQGTSSGFGSEPLDVDTILSVLPTAAYVRLVLRKVDNSELLLEETSNVKATGKSVDTGDWNGGHLDNYYVRKDKAVYSADEIVFTYDVDETTKTRGFLKLPPNYAPVGNPVPLIVFVHGSGDLNSITATAMTDTYEQYYNFLRDSGYAVFDCYSFGNKYSGEDTWGLPINRQCYMAGIRYVCKTYNVDIDNVFVSCKSLGGIQALSMFYDETMPVKAVGMLAPELDPFNVYMGYAEISKRNIAAELGFSEDTGNVLAFNQGDSVPEGFWDYITENMGKWSGQFAFFCGLPIKASEKATYYRKGHTTGDMCRTSLNRPVKIWIAEDDNAVSYAVSSAFIQSLNNGGYKGELRTMPSGTGKHHAVDNDANALQTTNVTTKCGIIYATVPTAYYELVQFFDKYCHK
jgi:hypothetical protein